MFTELSSLISGEYVYLRLLFLQESFYDPVSRTGCLEYYMRERRSRSAHIQTLWTHAKKGYCFVLLHRTP